MYLNLLDRTKSSKLVRYVLIGIVGFMIGYLYYYSTLTEYEVHDLFAGTAFWGTMTWGLTFGLIQKKPMRGLKLGIAGVVGFFSAFYLSWAIIILFPFYDIILLPISFIFIGIIGGISYGLVLWDPMKVLKMAVAGSLGVSIGGICYLILRQHVFLSFMSYGIMVGAFLGAGMYFAEKDDM